MVNRNIITIFLFAFLSSVSVLADETAKPKLIDGSFDFTHGYRIDELDWNFAGPNNEPNVLSELTWDELESYQIQGSGRLLFKKAITLKGRIAYGWIYGGEVQDSDYAGNDRTLEFSRSTADADNGNLFDGSIGGGYRLSLGDGMMSLTPLAGYSFFEQDLVARNGFQEISVFPEITGPAGSIIVLDSSYESEWKGPWVGVDLAIDPTEKFSLLISLEYHFADYEAQANWNLREDLAHPVSFSHDADGDGIVVNFSGAYRFRPHIALKAGVEFQTWSTDSGTNTVFLSDGTSASYQLNDVNWDSFTLWVGLGFVI